MQLRHALRMFFRQRRTSAIIVLTLALGIGSSTAVFSILNSLVLRPLPYKDPAQLVRVYSSNPAKEAMFFSVAPADYQDWKQQSRSFDDLAALTRAHDYNIKIQQQPERVTATRVSPNLFALLGAQPMLGRFFTKTENVNGGGAILSFGLWQTRFAGDPAVIGRSFLIDGKPNIVVGVMPSGFRLPYADAEMYLPMAFTANELERGNHFLRVMGRLKKNVPPEQALVELKTVAARLEKQYPEHNLGWSVVMRSLNEVVVPERFRAGLWIFFGAVGLVLLIACANVSNLMVARTLSRRREIAVRLAIGASRLGLLGQLLMEGMIPAVFGGALGTLLATWAVHWIRAFAPPNIPRLEELTVNATVLLFALGVSLCSALIYGSVAALQIRSADIHESLKEEANRGTAGGRQIQIQNCFVIAEAALAVVLLVGACLLIKSYLRLEFVDPGFNPKNLMTVAIAFPQTDASEASAKQAQSQLLMNTGSQSGIESVALASMVPMGPGNSMDEFSIEGKAEEPSHAASFRVVSPNYFSLMSIRLVRGSFFDPTQGTDTPGTVIIDHQTAVRYWHNEDPLGKRIVMSGSSKPLTVIGIVDDVRSLTLNEEEPPMIYFSTLQSPPLTNAFVVARSNLESAAVANALRNSINEFNGDVVIGAVQPLSDIVDASLSQQRFQVWILMVFAGIAVLLAAVGIYSVIAYRAAQRTREIGIRMAVGARAVDVIKMVLKQGLVLAGAGVALGVVGSYAATRLLASLLFQVSPTDAGMFQMGMILFLLIAGIAAYLPARKASKLDPVVALRHE